MYLNGELEESVYMEIPDQLSEVLRKIVEKKKVGSSDGVVSDKKIVETAKRWHRDLKSKDDCVCLLKKSLYGLRQSGLPWYKKLVDKLKKLNFEALPQDQCMFLSRNKGKIMLIAVYVDDMILATNCNKWLREIKRELSNVFEMKDFGKQWRLARVGKVGTA